MSDSSRVLLIVDDEINIANSLRRELMCWVRERKLSIKIFESAIDALSFTEENGSNIDVIVTDLHMSGLDGLTFLTKVHEKYPNILTIVLTGSVDENINDDRLYTGEFICIRKPWEPDELNRILTEKWNEKFPGQFPDASEKPLYC